MRIIGIKRGSAATLPRRTSRFKGGGLAGSKNNPFTLERRAGYFFFPKFRIRITSVPNVIIKDNPSYTLTASPPSESKPAAFRAHVPNYDNIYGIACHPHNSLVFAWCLFGVYRC